MYGRSRRQRPISTTGTADTRGWQTYSVDPLHGKLLIAAPALHDPNFERTVVLVAEHSDEGALGLVLNRPSDVDLREGAPDLASLVEEGDRIFLGGPVEPSGVLVLAEFEDVQEAAGVALGDIGFVGPEPPLSGIGRARAFAGHAGWAAGQLDAEVAAEGWIIEPAIAADVFCVDPDALWSTVLRRKGGRDALLTRMPLDPRVN